MEEKRSRNYFIGMYGVLMRAAAPIPGAEGFIERLIERGANSLPLTNNSLCTPRDPLLARGRLETILVLSGVTGVLGSVAEAMP